MNINYKFINLYRLLFNLSCLFISANKMIWLTFYTSLLLFLVYMALLISHCEAFSGKNAIICIILQLLRNQQTAGTTNGDDQRNFDSQNGNWWLNLDTHFLGRQNQQYVMENLVCGYFYLFCLAYDMNNNNKLPYIWQLTPFIPCFAAKILMCGLVSESKLAHRCWARNPGKIIF